MYPDQGREKNKNKKNPHKTWHNKSPMVLSPQAKVK